MYVVRGCVCYFVCVCYICTCIQRNIHNFGAVKNPRVVVHGESAGGFSVGALLTSPLTKGLFDGAIMESSYSAFR